MDVEEVKQAIEEGFAPLMTATRQRFEKLETELKAERAEREALELKFNRGGLSTGADSLGETINRAGLAAEHKAMTAFVHSEVRDAANCPELKAMSVGSDPDGGYIVMPHRSATMIKRLYDESPLRRLARVETMTTGDAWEEVIDLDEAGSEWVGEHDARPATTTPRIGLLNVPLREAYAQPKVTQKLMDTSYIDVGAWLDGKINDKFARGDALAFVSGNTPARPRGFLTAPTALTGDFTRPFGELQYVKTGAAASFAAANPADCLRQVMWKLRAPYRRDAAWLMNSNTASLVDQFKDGTGNYIWRAGQTAGAPASLLGYAVEIDENMPDVGAGEYPIAFGNWKQGYLVVERPGVKMLRDPFTDKPNVLFYAYRRVGGDVANSDAIKLLKCEA